MDGASAGSGPFYRGKLHVQPGWLAGWLADYSSIVISISIHPGGWMAAGGVCLVFVFRNQRVDARRGAPPLLCFVIEETNLTTTWYYDLFPSIEKCRHIILPRFQRSESKSRRSSGLSIASMNTSCENDSLVFLSSF